MILVVDDDRELCEALAEFLSIHGHAVRCARNGREALRLLDRSATPPELIFSDLMMPVLDGWHFIAEVEKDPELAEVPVVIMSADRDVAQTAKEAGAVAFVRKPVEPQTLLRIVDHFGKGSSRQSEL